VAKSQVALEHLQCTLDYPGADYPCRILFKFTEYLIHKITHYKCIHRIFGSYKLIRPCVTHLIWRARAHMQWEV
jgi:hypothetical protein